MRRSLYLVVLLAACGGDDVSPTSGVAQATAITELSAGDVTTFCSWAIELQGGAGHETTCPDDVTFTVNTQAECEMEYSALPAACSGVTVGEMEACMHAFADDPCTAFGAQVCAEYLMCVFGQ